MSIKFPDSDARREVYAVVAIVIGGLGLSHALGYWPHGSPASQGTPQQVINGDFLWRAVYTATLLLVGLLYYLGRRAGVSTPSSSLRETPSPAIIPVEPIHEPDFAGLVIHSANYRAREGGGKECNVVPSLRKLSRRGSLV